MKNPCPGCGAKSYAPIVSSGLGVKNTCCNVFIETKRVESKENRNLVKSMPCVVGIGCFGVVDPDHLKTRGAGGGDEPSNLMPVCRLHHSERHQIGIGGMMDKYPAYAQWLIDHGHEDLIERILFKRASLNKEKRHGDFSEDHRAET